MIVFDTFFFFNDTATTEIYTLSLHDALPILAGLHVVSGEQEDVLDPRLLVGSHQPLSAVLGLPKQPEGVANPVGELVRDRSEEHTSELQSRQYLVCRLLLEKKKNNQ